MSIQKYKQNFETPFLTIDVINAELKSLRSISEKTKEIKDKIYFILEKKEAILNNKLH